MISWSFTKTDQSKFKIVFAYLKCTKTFFQVSIHWPKFKWLVDAILYNFRGVVVSCFYACWCDGFLHQLERCFIVSETNTLWSLLYPSDMITPIFLELLSHCQTVFDDVTNAKPRQRHTGCQEVRKCHTQRWIWWLSVSEGNHHGLETKGRHYQKSKTSGISDPMKRNNVFRFFFEKLSNKLQQVKLFE